MCTKLLAWNFWDRFDLFQLRIDKKFDRFFFDLPDSMYTKSSMKIQFIPEFANSNQIHNNYPQRTMARSMKAFFRIGLIEMILFFFWKIWQSNEANLSLCGAILSIVPSAVSVTKLVLCVSESLLRYRKE